MKKANLMLIKGLKPSDFIIYGNNIKYEKEIYNNIPNIFTTVEEWPKYTNLLCWNCSEKFNHYPRFIVKSIVKSIKAFNVIGNFCSWSCALTFIIENESIKNKFDSISLLKKAEKLFSKNDEPIKQAPTKTIRKKYCGDIGISNEEYLQYLNH